MVKKTISALLTASLVVCTVFCTIPMTSVNAKEDKAQDASAASTDEYTEEVVPVYRTSLSSNESVTVRKYGDLPYMKIDEYYNSLYSTGAEKYSDKVETMNVTRTGSTYETNSYDGTKGVFDTDKNTFECENLDVYSMPPYYSILLSTERDPSAPFVRVSGTDYSGEIKPLKVDFGAYGINLIGDGDDLWVPISVLQCIFCSPYAYNAYYNGKGIYMDDGMEQLQESGAKATDENYYAFTENERSEERIALDYGTLCFYVDNCYGYPDRSRLSESIPFMTLRSSSSFRRRSH